MDYSKSYIKAIMFLSPNGLKIYRICPSFRFFRILFINGQKHLKSLLLLHDLFGEVNNMPCLNRLFEKRHVRPHICMEEEEEEMEAEAVPSV